MKRAAFVRCAHCGASGVKREVRPIRFAPLRPDVPDVDVLDLCNSCRTEPNRTWRRRWREQPDGSFDELTRSHQTFSDLARAGSFTSI